LAQTGGIELPPPGHQAHCTTDEEEDVVAGVSPTVRRRRLGLILRGLREKANLTGEDVGVAIERSGSWVSRVETGRVGLRGRDLNDLLELYQVEDRALSDELLSLAREGKQRGWWSKYADTLFGQYSTYIGFESEAAELLVYETLLVHGLLQTEEYARAMFSATIPANSPDLIERKVRVRLERQELLTRANPLRLWAILDESVLCRRIGGQMVLRGQMKHLLEIGLLPNVTIQIVPFDTGPHPGMIGSFTIVKFPDETDPDILYIEGQTGDIFAESEDVRWSHEVFNHMRAAALSPSLSRQRIEEAWDALA
jgi:transcriptional regulator with XRE-family HTH domain